jgi:hypothetical protein
MNPATAGSLPVALKKGCCLSGLKFSRKQCVMAFSVWLLVKGGNLTGSDAARWEVLQGNL